jgi:hypothetical protein
MKNVKLNDLVKVQVNGRFVQGYVIQLNEGKALVQVPVFYGQTKYIEVESRVEDLMPVYKDYKDWERFNNK